jgi:hypothetical protein
MSNAPRAVSGVANEGIGSGSHPLIGGNRLGGRNSQSAEEIVRFANESLSKAARLSAKEYYDEAAFECGSAIIAVKKFLESDSAAIAKDEKALGKILLKLGKKFTDACTNANLDEYVAMATISEAMDVAEGEFDSAGYRVTDLTIEEMEMLFNAIQLTLIRRNVGCDDPSNSLAKPHVEYLQKYLETLPPDAEGQDSLVKSIITGFLGKTFERDKHFVGDVVAILSIINFLYGGRIDPNRIKSDRPTPLVCDIERKLLNIDSSSLCKNEEERKVTTEAFAYIGSMLETAISKDRKKKK